LQLGQEARVLDRDHRLIGERAQERHLVVGLAARDGDRADRRIVSEQRHDHHAPIAQETGVPTTPVAENRVILGVGNIRRRSSPNHVRVCAVWLVP
jgi:hypothetical protein